MNVRIVSDMYYASKTQCFIINKDNMHLKMNSLKVVSGLHNAFCHGFFDYFSNLDLICSFLCTTKFSTNFTSKHFWDQLDKDAISQYEM